MTTDTLTEGKPVSEMVERVKAAIAEHVGHDNWVDDWDKVARAAIAAMRDATPAMYKAGYDDLGAPTYKTPGWVWHAMIDEALR